MTVDHANAIPIADVLSKLNLEPERIDEGKIYYFSPLTTHPFPTFQIDLKLNRWSDAATGKEGTLIDFVCAFLKLCREAHTKSDAVRWINNMTLVTEDIISFPAIEDHDDDSNLILKSKATIQHLGLIHFLEKYSISLDLGRRYLEEIHVQNPQTRKSLITLGLLNEEGGYELRNPFYEGFVGPRTISFIRGTVPKPSGLHIFLNFFDYLAALSQLKQKTFKRDTIVLNSLSCLNEVSPYIQNYSYRIVCTWLNNDSTGKRTSVALSLFLSKQNQLQHLPMNSLYGAHRSVLAWHLHQNGLDQD